MGCEADPDQTGRVVGRAVRYKWMEPALFGWNGDGLFPLSFIFG